MNSRSNNLFRSSSSVLNSTLNTRLQESETSSNGPLKQVLNSLRGPDEVARNFAIVPRRHKITSKTTRSVNLMEMEFLTKSLRVGPESVCTSGPKRVPLSLSHQFHLGSLDTEMTFRSTTKTSPFYGNISYHSQTGNLHIPFSLGRSPRSKHFHLQPFISN